MGKLGPAGAPGLPGVEGERGARGFVGVRGPMGGVGENGTDGDAGNVGDTRRWAANRYHCPSAATDTMRLAACSRRGCRLEVLFEDAWGTVCSQGFEEGNAPILCRAFGFLGGGMVVQNFGRGTGTVWLEDVKCKGGEGDVGDCRHEPWAQGRCTHQQDVGLCCIGEPPEGELGKRAGPSYFPRCPAAEVGDFRLVDCNREVCRAEVKHDGKWGTICDNGFTQRNAETLCGFMGFSEGKFKQGCATQGALAGCAPNEAGTGPIWLDDLFCFGYEKSIDGCRHRPWGITNCDHTQDVGLCCSGDAKASGSKGLLLPKKEVSGPSDYQLDWTFKGGFSSTTGGAKTRGPALKPLFGGDIESSGFHFVPGAGLGFDPWGYINPDSYTVYMHVWLDKTTGMRNLLHSNGWQKDGIYVNSKLMVAPEQLEIQCEEKILPNRFYKYVVRRAETGEISLFLHGGLCAEGVPDKKMGFKDVLRLNPHSMSFVADMAGQNGEGYVSRIRVFNKALTDEEVAAICDCQLPERGPQCKDVIVVNAVPLATEFSSQVGTPDARLNSPGGWLAQRSSEGQYMQWDTGMVQSIIGVVTQGHRTEDKWVTSYKVSVSVDGSSWRWVQCGAAFDANSDRNSKIETHFHEPAMARHVRIYPITWQGGIGMRAGAVVCERACNMASGDAPALDYKFQLSLVSATGGPPMQAAWGEGSFYRDRGGTGDYAYQFSEGEGLEVDITRCINGTSAYTVMLWAKLNSVDGAFRRVMTSRGWGDYGLYVNKYLQMVPAGAHLQCAEPLRPGNWYKIYVTRDAAGLVRLFMRGAVCAEGNPPFKNNYALNHGSLILFRDDGDENTGGTLRHVQIWDHALSESEIELREECSQPRRGITCPFTIVYNAPLHRTVYSSVRGNSAPGTGLGRGRINSGQAWCPATSSPEQFMQVDLGYLQNVSGIVTQGRRDADEWVASFSVRASEDGVTWTDVGCGIQFEANTNRGMKVKNAFPKPILARFLRVHPQTWQGGACMRMGVLLCEGPCEDGLLTYDFGMTFASASGGPSLLPAWGDGEFDSDGYHFEAGLGFELDSRRCTNTTKEYTMMMDVSLADVERMQSLFSVDGWDEGGLAVKNWLQLAPAGTNMVCEGTRLKPNQMYKVGITRTETGKITIYLDGAECASGNPPFYDYYRLNDKRILFLHDDYERTNPAGVVRSIKLWDRSLSREEVADEASCKLPDVGQRCRNNLALNAIYQRISYSSVSGGATPGSGLGTGRLNSLQGWAPASSSAGQWMQIDTGEVQSIVGIVTQGRRDVEAWVTEYSVQSSTDGVTWHSVQCGRTFKANQDKNSKVKVVFRSPIRSRFVRIVPEEWKSSIGMRAGVLVCEQDCVGGQLHYEFTKGTFMSSTQGPAIDAPWGDGSFSTTMGWKFNSGEGLELDQDEEGCMNNHVFKPAQLNTAYSIFVDVKLDSIGGWQRIIGSRGWGDTGLYVNDRLMIYPPGAGVKCREKLQPDTMYRIGMTRSLEGEVKLYLNGAMCAHGRPLFNKGFMLDQNNIRFFHDQGSEHAEGYVKDIHIWNRVLSEQEAASMSSCMLAARANRCSRNIVLSPNSANFVYSSIKNNDSPGAGLGRGRLNSLTAWSAGSASGNEYLQIDTGAVGTIAGVVLQGRRDQAQWVKSFTVQVSSDAQRWVPVMCGMQFEGSEDQNTKTKVLFRDSVAGRYVRVVPTRWRTYPSMRLGVLICEKPCEGGTLDYQFKQSFLSDSDGPALDPAWGEGVFTGQSGYGFSSGQGLLLDAASCAVHPEKWTVLVQAKLGATGDGWHAIFGSKSWGDYGLYVNERLQLYPPGTGLMCLENIRPNQLYTFVLTRDESEKVALYLNGYKCGEGSPPYAEVYLPDMTDLNFFRSSGPIEEGTSGSVEHIKVWNRALSDSEVAESCHCTLSPVAKACDNVIIYNPAYTAHSASSNKESTQKGNTCNSGRLHSPSAWCPRNNQRDGSWMQIDTGKVQTIEGVVTQGRRDANEWVKLFKVMVSQNGETWSDVQCGSVFPANTDRSTKVQTKFDHPLEARYIRIFPTGWNSAPAMRAGVLVCQGKCTGNGMNFDLQDSLASENGGPNLRAPWGLSTYQSNWGYTVENGQGFVLQNAGSCLDAQDYTVMLRLYMSATDGDRRIFSSGGWGRFGLFVINNFFTLQPDMAMMRCSDETIFTSEWYLFTMTRDKEGHVALFINGRECAQGAPLQVGGYALDANDLTFLHDDRNAQFSGLVSKVRVLDEALSKEEVASQSGCTLLPSSTERCPADVTFTGRGGSWNAVHSSGGCQNMYLDGQGAWCSSTGAGYVQIDTGEIQTIVGVVTQGRYYAPYFQWVTYFTVEVSSDGNSWTHVDCGRKFEGNSDGNTKVRSVFAKPVVARIVRVRPYKWSSHPSMRLGVLLCETACENSELIYPLTSTTRLESSTGGPELTAPWGLGSLTDSGYSFSAGQGLQLAERNCFNPEQGGSYTLVAFVNFDSVSNYRRVFNSRSWGDYGVYVYYGTLWLYPDSGSASTISCLKYPLRAGVDYVFAMTRTTEGTVTLFVNGQSCGSGQPPYKNHFQVSAESVTFFRDDGSENSGGFSKGVQAYGAALDSAQLSDLSGCSDSRFRYQPATGRCSTEVFAVSRSNMAFDDANDHRSMNDVCARPELNSDDGWCSLNGDTHHWLQLDFGKIDVIAGVAIQGRACCDQYVTAFSVKVSQDGTTWKSLRCGLAFQGTTDMHSITERYFDESVVARYVRVYPEQWHSYPSMRAGLIACAQPCENSELHYEFSSSLKSSTKGPSLEPSWGQGSFHTSGSMKYYAFAAGAGLEVDASKCLATGDVYTISMSVYLDDAGAWNRLVTSENWKRAGLYVKDHTFGLWPEDLGISCEGWYIYSTQWTFLSMVREHTGRIRLAVNGYECASGDPEGSPNAGLELRPNFVAFFYDEYGRTSGGRVADLVVKGSAMSESELRDLAGCRAATLATGQCSNTVTFNVPYSGHTYSSSYSNNAPGGLHATGRLDSEDGQVFPNNNQGHTFTLDSGAVQQIAGVVMQGRSSQWITKFAVDASDDGQNWKDVDCGRSFQGNTDGHTKLSVSFAQTVMARYIRIRPQARNSHMSMRAGLLLCEQPCGNGELDYQFAWGLTSTTGGPSLTAPWGMGTYTNSDTLQFSAGDGLQLDESECIKDSSSYSVYIEVKFGDLAGERAIMTSETWPDSGLYSVDGYLSVKPTSLVCQGETLRNNVWYKFGITRDAETKTVSLFLNGYLCATGQPRQRKGFALNPANMIFFRGQNSASSAGEVKQIRIWDQPLSDAEMTQLAGCELPITSPRCDKITQFKPDYSQYSSSSIHKNAYCGEFGCDKWGRARIGDPYGWIPHHQRYEAGQWLQVDMGAVKDVAGVVTQGRSDAGWWITLFQVSVSDDGSSFQWVECGRMFGGNTDQDTQRLTYFDLPVKARYVRVVIQSWNGGPAMRLGILECSSKCVSKHLDYETNKYLTSSSGGPGLVEEWGTSQMDLQSGWRATAGKGLVVDAGDCLTDTSSWSIVMQAQFDNPSDVEVLATTEGWGDAGLYVKDERLQMFPSGKLVCGEKIRPGLEYWFAATRDGQSNNVSLYLNGYPCNTAKTLVATGFRLDPPELIFMRRFTDDRTVGYVKRIEVWNRKLTDAEILSESGGCALPAEGEQCKKSVTWTPLYSDYSASSTYDDQGQFGNQYSRPHLNSPDAWLPHSSVWNTQGQWLQMNLAEEKTVVGIVTQGRGDAGWWTNTYVVKVSTNGETWTDVECGRIFDANTNNYGQVERAFTRPVRAKYVRIYPRSWHGLIALRAALMLCETRCLNGQLDYQTTVSLAAVSGGPSLLTPWGGTASLDSNAGWRFTAGQGLKLDADACFETKSAWSMLLEARFDSVSTATILTTPSWGGLGLYVWNARYTMRAGEVSCDEPIRANYFYQFGVTRTKAGKVTLFLNGQKCGDSVPVAADGFPLQNDNVEFFHNERRSYSQAGWVRRVRVWDDAQSDAAMQAAVGFSAPQTVPPESCSGEVVWVPPMEAFSASSIHGNYAWGQSSHSRPQLDDGSSASWLPQTTTAGAEWLSIDLGSVRKVKGLVTQSRSGQHNWVKTYKVRVSQSGESFKDIEGGRIFDGNDRYGDTKVRNEFKEPVLARYVRISPETCNSWCAMRVAVLLCERDCDEGHMDFNLKKALRSVTGGPQLIQQWGAIAQPFGNSYQDTPGYRFGGGQGFTLAGKSCLGESKPYSWLLEARFDSVGSNTRVGLFNLPTWGAAGAEISAQRFQLFGPGSTPQCDETLLANEFYTFGMTRNTSSSPASVSLYLNGIRCGTWQVLTQDGFVMEGNEPMRFLHPGNTAGYVRRLQLWDHALSPEQMASESGVELPEEAGMCSQGIVQVNPDYDHMSASSIWSNQEIGEYHGRGAINSGSAWVPRYNEGSFLVLRLDEVGAIAGVVTQARYNSHQMVRKFKVAVSQDNTDYSFIDGGRVFIGNTQYGNDQIENLFTRPVLAKFVRIYPTEWQHSHASMRAGLLVCAKGCTDKRLSYTFVNSLSPQDGGPALAVPWGSGTFQSNKYNVPVNTGLRASAQECMANGGKEYTVLFRFKADTTQGKRFLIGNSVWDSEDGFFIQNARFGVLPVEVQDSPIQCAEVIRTDKYYYFGVTRNSQGELQLYLNGWPCASGRMFHDDGFQLSGDTILLHGQSGENTAGKVAELQMWGRALQESEMATVSGCTRPTLGAGPCAANPVTYVPRYKRISASGVSGNQVLGQGVCAVCRTSIRGAVGAPGTTEQISG